MATRAGFDLGGHPRTLGRRTVWDLTTQIAEIPTVVVVGALVIVAAVLRLTAVASWPVFFDEDSYVETAMAVARVPLSDGLLVATRQTFKPPLQTIVHGAFIWLGADPLVAGRAIVAAAGLVTTALVYLLGRRLGGRAVGLVASVLYALSPMAVLHERMLNHDAWLTAFGLAATLASLVAVERRSWRAALIASVAGALAVQIKTPGLAVAAVPVLALLVGRRSSPPATPQAALAMAGPVMSYVALMMSPIGLILSVQNAMLMEPFGAAWQNAADVSDALWTYFPAGLALLLIAGFAFAVVDSPRLALILAIMTVVWIAPWVALSMFAPSRYYLSALPILCAFGAMALVRIPSCFQRVQLRVGATVVAVALVAAAGFGSVRLVHDHANAPLSDLDAWQYRSGWPSGYGLSEAAMLFRRVAEPGSSVVYLVHLHHVVGAGLFADLPSGVRSLGRLETTEPLPRVDGRLYVVVDDSLDSAWRSSAVKDGVSRVEAILADRPDLEIIGRFPRPGSSLAVTVLRSR